MKRANADSPTGKSGNEAGAGSGRQPKSDAQGAESSTPNDTSQDPQTADDPAERDGQPKPGNPSDHPEAGESQSGKPGEGGPSGSGQTSTKPTDGGDTGDAADQPVDERPAVADKANLEYARKVTDLTLERLEDQVKKDKVDPKLLDKLGWSKADMQRFLARWQKMKRDAQRTDRQGAEARRELDDALRSLGVRKDRVRRGAGSSSDAQRGLRQSQRRATPTELREQLEAYLRRTSRGK